MDAKNKLFIVVYQNIGNIDESDIPYYLNEIRYSMNKLLDDSVILLIVPVRNEETHIEFFNIENVKTKTLEEVKELINSLNY